MDLIGLDLTGIAALITALTGVASLLISVYLVLTLRHVRDLTNSNFSQMQVLLAEAIDSAKVSADRDHARHEREDARQDRLRSTPRPTEEA